jgi:hypothetical protein
MNDLDPSDATDVAELVKCLLQLHIRVDKPSFRTLEERTKHANGTLPGTTISRIPLRRSTLSDVLQGNAFPRKAFLLTFVEACGVNLETDRRWERAWDRLAEAREEANETAAAKAQQQLEEMKKQLAEAEERATEAEKRAAALAEIPNVKDAVDAGEAGSPLDDQKPPTVTDGVQQVANASDSMTGRAKVTKKSAGDRRRLSRLLMDVVRVAHSVSDESAKAAALARLSQAAASTDPDRAERIAESILNEAERAEALARLAQAAAVVDPARAGRLTMAAEAVANAASPAWKGKAFAAIGQVAAATDPDRAERIAALITDAPAWRAWLLIGIAQEIARTDADRAHSLASSAEVVARSIADAGTRATVLCRIARAAAGTDPDLAAWLITDAVGAAQSIGPPQATTSYVIPATAAAQSAEARQRKDKSLAGVARAAAEVDPDYAERIAESITSEDEKGDAQVGIVRAVVRADLNRAERIAEAITSQKWRAAALARIAQAAADTDPDRAERIAESIASEDDKGDGVHSRSAVSWV